RYCSRTRSLPSLLNAEAVTLKHLSIRAGTTMSLQLTRSIPIESGLAELICSDLMMAAQTGASHLIGGRTHLRQLIVMEIITPSCSIHATTGQQTRLCMLGTMEACSSQPMRAPQLGQTKRRYAIRPLAFHGPILTTGTE